jgi:hypothetical protein
MERRSTFAATIAGNNFCPRRPVLSSRVSLEVAVDKNWLNEVLISASASWVAACVASEERNSHDAT